MSTKAEETALRRVLFLTDLERRMLARLSRGEVTATTERPRKAFGLRAEDASEDSCRDVLERFVGAQVISAIDDTKQAELTHYSLECTLDAFLIVEIEERPRFEAPDLHVGVVRRLMSGEGPDPNRDQPFRPAFARWMTEIGVTTGSSDTMLLKVKGYAPKSSQNQKGLSSRWGVLFHDKESNRWLLGVQGFLAVDLVPVNKEPRVVRRAKRRAKVPTSKPAASTVEPKSASIVEPAPPAEPTLVPELVAPPIEAETPKELSLLEKLEAELSELVERVVLEGVELEAVAQCERALEAARQRLKATALSDADRARLEALRTAREVIKSLL